MYECSRMGCDAQAVVLLTFAPQQAKAWLYDLAEPNPAAGISLCRRHGNATVVPMSWQLIDARDPSSPVPSRRGNTSTALDPGYDTQRRRKPQSNPRPNDPEPPDRPAPVEQIGSVSGRTETKNPTGSSDEYVARRSPDQRRVPGSGDYYAAAQQDIIAAVDGSLFEFDIPQAATSKFDDREAVAEADVRAEPGSTSP